MKHLFLLLVVAVFFVACTQKQVVSIVVDEKGENVITSVGNKVLKNSYDKVYLYNDDYIKIQIDKKYGIVNYDGKMSLEAIYTNISPLYYDFATISLNDKVGLVDSSMKIVLDPLFQSIKIEDNYFVVQKDNKYTCMNNDLKTIGNSYDYIYYFVDGFARVENGEKFGFINEDCEEVTDIKYEYVSDFRNGFVKVKENEKFSFLDKNFNKITKEAYTNANYFEGK